MVLKSDIREIILNLRVEKCQKGNDGSIGRRSLKYPSRITLLKGIAKRNPFTQPEIQPSSHSFDQAVTQSASQLAGHPAMQRVSRPVNHSASQSARQSVS